MIKLTKDQKAILQCKIAEHLGNPFTLKRTRESEHDKESSYDVIGIMGRHGGPVNVRVTIKKDGDALSYWSITDEAISMKTRYVGKILLGKDVCVSDPCYDRDVWCRTTLENVKPGVWTVDAAIDTIDCWGERCYILELYHETVDRSKEHDWADSFNLGVDSGTMSVIDDRFYQADPGPCAGLLPGDTARERFLNKCYDLKDGYAGLFKVGNKRVGVVCSSGCGDGGYPLYVVEEDGEIVAMKISFM
jgi:hypothetical protein